MELWINLCGKFKELPIFICWGVWKLRNDVLFNNKRQHYDVVCSKMIAYFQEHFKKEKTKKQRLIISPVISSTNVVGLFDGIPQYGIS